MNTTKARRATEVFCEAENPFLQSIEIKGFRGFADTGTFNFAIPDGRTSGSGLTLIVGANNSGKSTILEALSVSTSRLDTKVSFSTSKRNISAGDKVKVTVTNTHGKQKILESLYAGGAAAKLSGEDIQPEAKKVFVLRSRRHFSPYFGESSQARDGWIASSKKLQATREATTNLSGRLFTINDNKEVRQRFNSVMKKVLDPVPDWIIDENDTGNFFLKYRMGEYSHTSDGLGEGIISLLFIIDALYDSEPGSVIAIDEPELSLHPAIQRKLKNLLLEYSKTRQIVISTHSPLFIDWPSISSGAAVIRVTKEDNACKVYSLSESTRTKIGGVISDKNNPHVFGLDANEVFFLDDGIVVLEGQEDVMFYPKALELLDTTMSGTIFGWGAGGADKFKIICSLLSDLGFKKVAGIVDNDKTDILPDLRNAFPLYHFDHLPTDDIRFKAARGPVAEKDGLIKSGKIDASHVASAKQLFARINKYLN